MTNSKWQIAHSKFSFLLALLPTFYFLLLTPLGLLPTQANCSASYLIDITLPSQARWTMCWEERAMEGVVLYDVTFTPPGGSPQRVLAQANLAQLHVPYDDNSRRLHDLTDFGLGGLHLDNLDPEECPDGELLASNDRNILCLTIKKRGFAYKYYGQQLQGYVLTLFSVSKVGAYNYIVQWGFYDNGTIEPAIGAAGELQFYTDEAGYGWPMNSANTIYGLAHTHNYYWRLDFDLNTATADAVEELEFTPNAAHDKFTISRTALTTESARQLAATNFRTWRIKDKTLTNNDGHAISYELEPDPIYIFRGPAYEPWTQAELYVTRYNACEKWATFNPTGGGCAENVSQFVNGQNVDGADVVLWYGHSFHHLPRDEDELYMHTHWSSFLLSPRDWNAVNPLVGVTPTAPTPTPPPIGAVVGLSSFTADWTPEAQVRVQWQAQSEINTAAYALLRSSGGLTWTQVYTTPNQYPCGAYASTIPLTYFFTDTAVISPTYYLYKLEFDGGDCNALSSLSTWLARARPPGFTDTFLPVILKHSG